MAVTINGTNGVTFNDSTTQATKAVGFNPTGSWGAITASTTYTNSSAYFVYVTSSTASVSNVPFTISGTTYNSVTANGFIVPPGATYSTGGGYSGSPYRFA
jgi:hypothetical protein